MASRPRTALLVLVALTAPLFAGCLGGPLPGADVLATAYPLGFIAERIAGPDLTVATMIPAGAEAHHWEPSVRDIDRMARSGLLLQQGGGFDRWADRAIHGLDDAAPPHLVILPLLDVDLSPEASFSGGFLQGLGHDDAHQDAENHTDHDHPDGDHGDDNHTDDDHGDDDHTDGDHGDDNHTDADHTDEPHTDSGAHDDHDDHDAHDDGHGHGSEDPHTWLDPVLHAQTAWRVAAVLMERFPDAAEGIQERTRAFVAELEALHASFEETLSDCTLDTIVVSHDAYSHLARRYGFHVAAVAGLSPEVEPDPRTIDRLIRLIDERDIPIVFFEESVDDGVVQRIAEKTGAEARVLSPIESLLPKQKAEGEDYFSLMAVNRDNLGDALRCQTTNPS